MRIICVRLSDAQEWVAVALLADGGGGTVTGQHSGFLGKRQQTGMNGVQNLAGVAAGQVGAADASCEKRVAGDEHVERGEMEADRTLGVTRRVQYGGWVALEADNEAVGQVGVG